MDNITVFNFFRDLYNGQLKFSVNCELAFQTANKLFFTKYGYFPYKNIEDYLSELFSNHDGFQLLE